MYIIREPHELICNNYRSYKLCSSRKNPYPPLGRSSKIPRGRGFLEAKNLEAKYEAKLEFSGQRGVQNKKPSIGGVWIFFRNRTMYFQSVNKYETSVLDFVTRKFKIMFSLFFSTV